MKTRLLIIALAIGLIATPAMAELFSIGVLNTKTVYTSSDATSGTFTADAYKNLSPEVQITSLSGSAPPAIGDSATLIWGNDPGSFLLSMKISNITGTGIPADPYGAVGSGSFVLKDVDDDKITADFTGKWVRLATQNFFDGILSNVLFDSDDGTFDGPGTNSVDMGFLVVQPWSGAITELVTNTNWFSAGDFNVTGGGISITVVPVPAALILGVLSLGAMGVGLKLRKLA